MISGLPTDRFAFEGFLPRKGGRRKAVLEAVKDDGRTLIFYEAPHRILETLEDMTEILGNRKAALIRELTKMYEEVIRGSLKEVHERVLEGIKKDGAIKGEMIIVLRGEDIAGEKRDSPQWKFWDVCRHVEALMKDGRGTGQAVKEVARLRGLNRQDVYRYFLETKDKQ